MPINEMRSIATFAKTAELGSLRRAAEAQGLTPQAASQALAQLEQHLGVRLFHRTSRVLQLTQEGEQFLAAAQKVMTALEEAEASIGPAATEATGVLRLSSTPAFARGRLAPLMVEVGQTILVWCGGQPRVSNQRPLSIRRL